MKYESTPRFDRDFKGLNAEQRRAFIAVVPAFTAACDAYAADVGGARWPAALRVRRMVGAPGVWEMTWSFASPDGRATFELVTVEGRLMVRWRRIGDHAIYRQP